MDIFFTLFSNIAPLYAIIVLGWIAGRFYGVDRESIAGLAIFVVVPVVSFYYVAGVEFKPAYAVLPFLVFCLYSVLTILVFQFGKLVYPDKRANLLAMCSVASNTGYFGLPLVILLLPAEWVGVYVLALVGGLLYEATVMYYIANRGNFSPKESVMRVLRFPVLYAVLLGLCVNFFGIDLPAPLDPYWAYFKGAYVVIGMMIVGCSLPKISDLVFAPKFFGIVFIVQFMIWPLIAITLISFDKTVLQWFEPEIHKMLLIMAIVPPAANITAFAAKLDLNPEKAATTILVGTVFAFFYIPVVLVLSGMY